MEGVCEVFVINNYKYEKDIKKALDIAANEGKHGDIICGTDYHMNTTSIIYKIENEIKIIKALDLNEFPKTIYNVLIEISKHIKNPEIFYKQLLDEEESFLNQDTFISCVELCEEHVEFISKFTNPDFTKNNYTIYCDYLCESNKNNYYNIKSFITK